MIVFNTINATITWKYESGTLTISGTDMPNYVKIQGVYPWLSVKKSVKKILIEYGVTNIAPGAFDGFLDLTSVTIPNSVTDIGKNAFKGCSRLTSITIPNSVTSIGEAAFYECTSLISFTFPNSVTSIAEDTFYGCSSLASVTISNSVQVIGKLAFHGCSSLTSVTIPNSVISIENRAFSNTNLQSVTIGTNVTSMSNPFYGSTPKKIIWLPNTRPKGLMLSDFGDVNYASNDNYGNKVYVYKHLGSMFEVDGIKYVPVSPSERTCDAIDCNYDGTVEKAKINDVVFYKNIGMTVLNVNPYACCGNEFIKTLNINSGNIAERAFEGCKNIVNVILGDNVKTIGNYAFSGCTSVNSIKIPDFITDINDYVFENCSSLRELYLGKNVKNIGKYAFVNCSSLLKLRIPKATTSIGDYAFSGCMSLADVTIEDRTGSISFGANVFTDCRINKVYLGGKLSYNTSSNAGYSPFYRNMYLQSVVITDTEEQIYDNEFYGCTNLKSVKIGDGVKSIGNWAFSGCANLESFSFGKSMQSIGKEAFSDCTKMTSITSYAATAPECGSQALDDIDKWSCVLSVPYSCLASYQNADQWKEFFFIQEAEVDEKLVAAKAAFDKYKSEQKTIIEALAKEDDSDAVKAIINKAISDINAMGYDVKISLDENKAKILSFINLIDDAVEKQRAEDQKTNGIEELEFADKYNIYDLNGRKITNSVFKSGLYIRNGKEVVVK